MLFGRNPASVACIVSGIGFVQQSVAIVADGLLLDDEATIAKLDAAGLDGDTGGHGEQGPLFGYGTG